MPAAALACCRKSTLAADHAFETTDELFVLLTAPTNKRMSRGLANDCVRG